MQDKDGGHLWLNVYAAAFEIDIQRVVFDSYGGFFQCSLIFSPVLLIASAKS